MAEFVRKFWSLIFIAGATFGHLSAHFMDDVEIHWRLFLIMLFTLITLGGYLTAMFSWHATLCICLAVLIMAYYQRKKFTNSD